MVEFLVAGDYWLHHLTLTLHPKSFIIFSADSVNLKGFVQHLVAPHPEQNEKAPGPEVNLEANVAGNTAVSPPPGSFLTADQFRRELQRRGINLPAAGRFGFDANSLPHADGSDEDTAIALMVAETASANAETFIWYLIGTAAGHPVPEPTAFGLMMFRSVRRGRKPARTLSGLSEAGGLQSQPAAKGLQLLNHADGAAAAVSGPT